MAVPEIIARRQQEWGERWRHILDAAARLSETTPHYIYRPPTGGDAMPDENVGARKGPINPYDTPMMGRFASQLTNDAEEPGLTVKNIDTLIRLHEASAEARVQAGIPEAQAAAFREGEEAGRKDGERIGRQHEHSQVDVAFGNVIHHLHLVAAIARRSDLTKKEMAAHLLAIETLLAIVVNRFGAEPPHARGERDRSKVLPIPDLAEIKAVAPKGDDDEPMSEDDVLAALLTAYGASYGKKALERMVAAGDFSDQLDPSDFEEPSIRV